MSVPAPVEAVALDDDRRIEAVICDFGGVLTVPLVDAFKAYERISGIPLKDLGEAMAGVGSVSGMNVLFELETGRITADQFTGEVGAELTRRLGRKVSMARFAEIYYSQLLPNEPVLDYMRELKRQGFRLAICTNNIREWQPLWLPRVSADEIFDHVIDSGFVGIRKPDRAIYDLTLERLGVPAEAAVLVDDTEVNCTAAREYGLSAVHFRSTEQALAELATLLL
jgi:epoxide hydrolase-like predicted phosphatase